MRKPNLERIRAIADRLDKTDPFSDRTVPPLSLVEAFLDRAMMLMLPSYFGIEGIPTDSMVQLCELLDILIQLIPRSPDGAENADTAYEILSALPEIKNKLFSDAVAIYEGDPAAVSVGEVLACYPGLYATAVYRLSHLIHRMRIPYLPRILSEIAHRRTGIDIHPGAEIGERLCIDHGTGIVIGETARIFDRVKIYQGVTIGAKSFERASDGMLVKGKRRHPTIGSDCIIYAGATILGGDTVIGDGCVIGGGVWLTHSLPSGSKVYHKEK